MINASTYPIVSFALAMLLGVVVGLCYFGGLLWTVRQLMVARSPWLLYFGSFLLRSSLVLLAFYGVYQVFDWPELLATMFGFLVGRLLMHWWAGGFGTGDVRSERAT